MAEDVETEVWMLDYLNAIVLAHGVFDSEESAVLWINNNDPERSHYYKVFKVPFNSGLGHVTVHAPNNVYRCPR